jgi:hypothetical protein
MQKNDGNPPGAVNFIIDQHGAGIGENIPLHTFSSHVFMKGKL